MGIPAFTTKQVRKLLKNMEEFQSSASLPQTQKQKSDKIHFKLSTTEVRDEEQR
jgi:hypothetical protein